MDLIQKTREALAMISEGRQALGQVVDALKDGSAALSAATVGEIDGLLEQERVENREANAAVTDAIADFRRRNP